MAMACGSFPMSGGVSNNYNGSHNTTTECQSDLKLFEIDIAWIIVGTAFMVAVQLFTVIGNSAVVVVFLTSDLLRSTVNNHFLVSLAIADLLVGFLVMPCAIDAFRTQTWRSGNFMKSFNAFGNFCFCISSIMHLMLLSVDKYISIARPLLYPTLMTTRRVYCYCVVVWIYSAFWALLPLIGISSYECFIPYIGKCATEDWVSDELNLAFAFSVVSGTYGVALVVMFVVYFKLGKIIRRQTSRVHVHVSNPDQKNTNAVHKQTRTTLQKHKGLVTIVLLIVTYLMCWSPFCVMLFIEIGQQKKLGGPATMVGMITGFSNSCCNPMIYWLKYKRFRVAIKRAVRLQFVNRLMDGSTFRTPSDLSQSQTHTVIRVKSKAKLKESPIASKRVIEQDSERIEKVVNELPR